MDRAGALQWVAIALAFVAVLVILRYGSRPRCELCRRRHHRRRATELAPPSTSAALVGAAPVTVLGPTPDAAGDEADIELDLTAPWLPNGHDREPAGPDLVAISWRADRYGVRTVSAADLRRRA